MHACMAILAQVSVHPLLYIDLPNRLRIVVALIYMWDNLAM